MCACVHVCGKGKSVPPLWKAPEEEFESVLLSRCFVAGCVHIAVCCDAGVSLYVTRGVCCLVFELGVSAALT